MSFLASLIMSFRSLTLNPFRHFVKQMKCDLTAVNIFGKMGAAEATNETGGAMRLHLPHEIPPAIGIPLATILFILGMVEW